MAVNTPLGSIVDGSTDFNTCHRKLWVHPWGKPAESFIWPMQGSTLSIRHCVSCHLGQEKYFIQIFWMKYCKNQKFYNYYLCAVCFGVFSASCIHLKSYNLAWAESQIYKIDALMSQMCVQLHLYRHRYHPIFIYGKSLWGEIATTTGKDEAFCG